MSRWISLVLGGVLALTLIAFGYAIVDRGHAESDMTSTIRYQQEEIASLRALSLKLAAGVPVREAVLATTREAPFEKGAWTVAGPLMVRYEGDKLEALCGSVAHLPDPCAEAVR